MSVFLGHILCCFICGFLLIPCSETTTRFTRLPPSVLYVSSGGTARFVWDYYADDRDGKFSIRSPVWSYYNQAYDNYSVIGADELNFNTNNWSFVINRKTCPPRLLNPDRVSRESKATLVITDVNSADNGIYQCTLVLQADNPINHQVQLVVTVHPTFLSNHPNKAYRIVEEHDLRINCTAIGPPSPNITWVNITDGSSVIKSQGSGSAVLNIDNIQRYHAGEYECQAKNNPNEDEAATRTTVTVYYRPTILKTLSSKITSWNGKQAILECIVSDGLPTPSITWYNPNGDQISTGVSAVAKRSQVVITTNGEDYGSYKCKATNTAGSDEHLINVTQLFQPGPVTVSITDVEASALTVRWTKPDIGGATVTGYLIEVSTKPPEITGNTYAVITGLKAGTQYTLEVTARNIVGYGATSATIVKTKLTGKPSIPHLLATRLDRQESKLSVFLRWSSPDQNGGNITRYTIYTKEVKPEAHWIKHNDVNNPQQVSYRIKDNIIQGNTYKFVVTAWNEYGESLRDERSARTVNTTADIGTAINAMEYCVVEGSKSCISSAVLGVIIALFVLSLVFNLLQFLYIKRRVNICRKKENQGQPRSFRKTPMKTGAGESYENDFKLEDNVSPAATAASRAQQCVPTGPEYETINQPLKNANQFDEASNYQELNVLPNTSIQGSDYEPLRTRPAESREPHSKNGQHPYEPLNVRNQNTTYQSLHSSNGNESAI